MRQGLFERILREAGAAELLEVLAERLAPTDLQSLLLEVYRRRAARQIPAGLLDQYANNRFVRPSAASPRAFVELDRLALSLASPSFEPIELSPVCPLGTNSVIAPISQNVTVATIRNTEVVSDSTNALALESALRRRANLRSPGHAADRVKLCASHRLLRAQLYDRPDLLAHFRAFALVTGGRDEGSHRFEIESLREHLTFYLRLASASTDVGHSMTQPRVTLTHLADGPDLERLRDEVAAPLTEAFPGARVEFDPDRATGRGYYQRLCFHVYATNPAGLERELVDGGFTDWTQTLLSDRKERLLISAIATEAVCRLFSSSDE